VKSFACGDVVPGCQSRWVCSTEDEILVRVAAHAASAHGLLEMAPELVSSVRKAIVPAG
jgi:predicted small metal-binding protein